MADVRSLLRAERQARAPAKQKAPIQVQNEKKRKAQDGDDDARKRTRAEDHANVAATLLRQSNLFKKAEDEQVDDAPARQTQIPASKKPSTPAISTKAPAAAPAPTVDEDEWAAFERDMATPPPQTAAAAASNPYAGTTISAAPLTAAELAAQAIEEKSAQRTRRDEDIAAEKEDAQRELEEEFEEMEQLEKRVQKLKEMRERVRVNRPESVAVDEPPEIIRASEEIKDSESDDDDDDFDDGWTFRPA